MNVQFDYQEAGPVAPIYFEQVYAEKPGGGRVANPTSTIPPTTAVYLNSKGLYEPIKGFRLVEENKIADTKIKVPKGSRDKFHSCSHATLSTIVHEA